MHMFHSKKVVYSHYHLTHLKNNTLLYYFTNSIFKPCLYKMCTNKALYIPYTKTLKEQRVHRYLLIILLTTNFLASSENDLMNIKVKQKKDIVNVKVLIHSPMRGAEQAKKEHKTQDYINHLSMHVGNRIVYDASLSEYLDANPIISVDYKFKNRGNILHIIAIDNKGNKFRQSKKIKYSSYTKQHDNVKIEKIPFVNYRNIKPNLWKTKTVNEAIEELYGHTESTSGKIEICSTPEGPYHKVKVNVRTKVLLESLLILTDANPSPVVALFQTTTDELINYEISITMLKSGYGNIIIIGKGLDENLYKTSHNVNVWSASCDGGGDNEVICHY